MKHTIDYYTYLDKVHGGWFGKCVGGAAGAALEGKKNTEFVKDFSEYFNADIPNDDLDIQLLWLEALEKYGLNLTQEIMAQYWLDKCWYPMAEYGCFLRNYEMGLHPPITGTYNNVDFDEDMGCPIRSEIWGYAMIGNPELAARFAYYDASLDHSDESIYAEQYLSVLASVAFFCDTTEKLFEMAEPYLVKGSRFEKMVHMIIEECKVNKDYKKIRQKILRLYGHYGFSSALQNVGFALMALILGNGDMRKSINIALWCGYDTDCSCATVAAILGTLYGYSALPNDIKSFVNDKYIIGIDVQRRTDSIYDLAVDTCALGIALAEQGNDCINITNIPDKIKKLVFESTDVNFEFSVSYNGEPCIEPNGEKNITLTVKNNTDVYFDGKVILDIPDYFESQSNMPISVCGGNSTDIRFTIKCKTTKVLANKNIIIASLVDKSNTIVDTYKFGLCGPSLWKMYGPYYDTFLPGKYKDKEPCDYEAAFNNDVDLDKDYLNMDDAPVELSFSTSMLDVEKEIQMKGQMCCYLKTNIICPDDREVWLQVGNNDGFILTLNGEDVLKRDEIRMYSPYNNFVSAKFKKGKNVLCFKLLRRTDVLKVGFRIKYNTGRHWNESRWCSDLSYDISD